MFDYNRKDAKGNTRELHTEKAIAVASMENVEGKEKFVQKEIETDGAKAKVLSDCEYFTVLRYDVEGSAPVNRSENRFEMLICTEGSGKILCDGGDVAFNAGDSMFIPAAMGSYTIEGTAEVIRSFVPTK